MPTILDNTALRMLLWNISSSIPFFPKNLAMQKRSPNLQHWFILLKAIEKSFWNQLFTAKNLANYTYAWDDYGKFSLQSLQLFCFHAIKFRCSVYKEISSEIFNSVPLLRTNCEKYNALCELPSLCLRIKYKKLNTIWKSVYFHNHLH